MKGRSALDRRCSAPRSLRRGFDEPRCGDGPVPMIRLQVGAPHGNRARTSGREGLMPTIYLDCDGVLADFDRGAERVLGLPPRDYERRFGLKRFWAALAAAPDFFDTLDPMSDAMELYEAVRAHNPVILTGL